MTHPGQSPQGGELPPVDPLAVREFNRIVLPLGHFNNLDNLDVALGEIPEADQALYGRIGLRVFPEGSEYVAATLLGSFDRLRVLADRATDVIVGDRELTVPSTFAIHSIVAGYAGATLLDMPPLEGLDDKQSFFLTHMASRLAWKTPVEAIEDGPDPFAFFKAIGKRTVRLAKAIGESTAWLQNKQHLLADRLILRQHVTRAIEAEPTLEVEDMRELEEMNTELFAELQRLDRINIPSSTYTEGDSTWSIHDMMAHNMQLAIALESTSGMIRPDRWEPHIIMQAVERQPGTEGGLINPSLGSIEIRPNYDQFKQQVYLGDDGNLYADMHGAVPLRQLYEAAEKPANYEVLRQLIMQMYFDHSVPAALVETAKTQTSQMLRTEDPAADRQRGIVYPDLLSARIHMLRAFANADELERSAGQDV